MIMYNKIFIFSFLSLLFSNSVHGIEEDAGEYEIPYPKEIRQNLISTNSFQEYNNHVGLYFEQELILSSYGDRYIPIFSSKAGVNINNAIQAYSGAYYLINNPKIEYDINGINENVNIYNFSSFIVGLSYTPFGEYFIHPKFRLEYGRANLLLQNNNVSHQIHYDSITPGVLADINVWKYFNIGTGVQYRYIFNNEKIIASNNFEFIFQILIGSF